MVSNQRGLAMKRKLPLMINDASQLEPSSKIQNISSFNETTPTFATVSKALADVDCAGVHNPIHF